MENFIAMQARSNLESMMESFMVTQTLYNEEFINQNLYTSEFLKQQNIMVKSLMTHNKALETKIS